jgi:hypothetical protein
MPANNTEFHLAQCTEPHLFVVRKQRRTMPANKADVMQYYYILGHERYTYQAPSLHAVVNARLRRAMHHVKEGFNRFKVRQVLFCFVLCTRQYRSLGVQLQCRKHHHHILGVFFAMVLMLCELL